MCKKFIFLLLTLSFLLLTSCHSNLKDEFREEYPQLTDSNHLYEVVNADFVISLLTDTSNVNYQTQTILVLGFKACPWCQAVIPYINEVAKEENYSKVYYVDIKDMRDNEESFDHPKYLTIKEKLISVIDQEKNRINAPTVVVLEKGQVLSFHLDTLPNHLLNENRILPPLNSSQEEELRNIFREMFEKK